MVGGGGVMGCDETSSILSTGFGSDCQFFCTRDFECEVTELDVSGGEYWSGRDGREYNDERVAACEGAGGGNV